MKWKEIEIKSFILRKSLDIYALLINNGYQLAYTKGKTKVVPTEDVARAIITIAKELEKYIKEE